MIRVPLILAACSYGVGTVSGLYYLLGRAERRSFAPTAGLVGAIFQFTFLVWLGVALRDFPSADRVGALELFALSLAVIYVALEQRMKFKALGAFALPVILALTLAGLFLESRAPVPATEHELLVIVHAVCALAGCGGFAFAALAAVAYLVQDRQLRLKLLTRLLERMASLDELDRLIRRATALGFLAFTISLIAGSILAASLSRPIFGNWVVAWSILVWVLYAVVLHLRLNASLRGRRVAYLTIGGFTLAAALFVCLLFVQDNLHKLAGG